MRSIEMWEMVVQVERELLATRVDRRKQLGPLPVVSRRWAYPRRWPWRQWVAGRRYRWWPRATGPVRGGRQPGSGFGGR